MTFPSSAQPPAIDERLDDGGVVSGGMARNLTLVISGRVGLLGAWFGATMLLARVLGPVAFGLYTLCSNAIRIFTGCFGDPLDMAVMREAPLYLRNDRLRALEIIRSAFWLRVALGAVSIAFTAAVPWVISRVVFNSREYRGLALLTAIGILGDLLLRSALGYFQAAERFGRFMWIDVVWQLGRVAAVVALVVLGWLTACSAILLYVFVPYIAFGIALFLLPADVLHVTAPHPQKVRAILHYSQWMVVATMMAAVYERLDLFLLSWFRGPHDVGIYGAAMTLAMIPDFLDGAIQTVLAPQVAPAYAAGAFARLHRRYLRYAIPLGGLAAVAALVLGGPMIRAFLSATYAESIPAFDILVLGTIFNFVFTPLPSALLNFVAPKKVMAVTAVGLLLVAIGGTLIIPRYGVVGAAVLILSARMVIGTLIVWLARGIVQARSNASK